MILNKITKHFDTTAVFTIKKIPLAQKSKGFSNRKRDATPADIF
jgi:hypothetical protein